MNDEPTEEQVLQCGHDPEAVEKLRGEQLNEPLGTLQCGHDPEAVESSS